MDSIFGLSQREKRRDCNCPKMEDEELKRLTPCSSLAVDSIIRVGTAGAVWGICAGPFESRQKGLTGLSKAAFVGKSVGWYGFQCGLVAGVFTSARCGLQRYREKDDLVNSLVAGALVGAAVAASTRNWNHVVGTTCLVSVFSAAADYFKPI